MRLRLHNFHLCPMLDVWGHFNDLYSISQFIPPTILNCSTDVEVLLVFKTFRYWRVCDEKRRLSTKLPEQSRIICLWMRSRVSAQSCRQEELCWWASLATFKKDRFIAIASFCFLSSALLYSAFLCWLLLASPTCILASPTLLCPPLPSSVFLCSTPHYFAHLS